jgi:hypothetical protein
VTGPGGTEADRAARERLAREARVTATTLLDWVGTRVEGAATTRTTRPAGADGARPRQSPGPCGWCPVCALVAAVRGEQPELTAHLAEQASALLVVLRLLIQSHANDHPAHEHSAPGDPAREADPEPTGAPRREGAAGSEPPRDVRPDSGTFSNTDVFSNPDVPWDAPHAVFDPDPVPAAPSPDGSSRSAPDRPTGKRGPRPSPRPRPVDTPTAPAPPPAPAAPAASAASAASAAPVTSVPGPAPSAPSAPVESRTPTTAARVPAGSRAPVAPARPERGVQRIPVRRRPRPC